MKIIFLSVIMVFLTDLPAICQQSLRFAELNNITLPFAITSEYVVDLNDDKSLEIILTTENYFYVYNAPYQNFFYRSPYLKAPRDLQFGDMDSDSLVDIAARQDTNLFVIDPYDSTVLWVSPALDTLSTSCYALGKIDPFGKDSYLILVRKERFNRPDIGDNLDTMWINIYHGPQFLPDRGYMVLLPNYEVGSFPSYSSSHEEPDIISIMDLGASGEIRPAMVLFSKVNYESNDLYNGHVFGVSGGVRIIDYVNGAIYHCASTGRVKDFTLYTQNRTKSLFSFNSQDELLYNLDGLSTMSQGWGYSFSINSLLNSVNFYNFSGIDMEWWGFLLSEINPQSSGPEFSYGWDNQIVSYSLPTLAQIWSSTLSNYSIINKAYSNNALFSHAQIMLVSQGNPPWDFQLRDGADGSLSAVIAPSDEVTINDIADLNNDSKDEILYVDSDHLHIYRLELNVNTAPNIIPKGAFLAANYPNPFNSSTIIRFGLADRGQVSIDIYDLLGRNVETLVNGIMPAGEHEVTWSADRNPSGIYFYSIKASGITQTRRMLLLK
jgi:hypothetical protein